MEMTTSSPPQLPDDILLKILKNLPLQTLSRFRCVCKSWHRLLTDPNTHIHLHHSSNPSRIILSRYNKSPLSISPNLNPNANPQELNLPLLEDNNTYYTKGHCHGLLCLILNDHDGTILLWNPSTLQYRKLPSPSNFNKTKEVIGFGFDSSVNDYKIVRAPSSYCMLNVKDYYPEVEVLTLSSNSWRKLPDDRTPEFYIEHFLQSLTLNGGLYWHTFTQDDRDSVILRFDLSKESFTLVPVPLDDTGRKRKISWLGVLKDLLCALHLHHGRTYFHIWSSRDDLNWEKLMTVTEILDPILGWYYAPLCFLDDERLVISVRGRGLVALVIYDGQNQIQQYIRLAALDDEYWSQETMYSESLVSPHGSLDDGTGSSSSSSSSVAFLGGRWHLFLAIPIALLAIFTRRRTPTKSKRL